MKMVFGNLSIPPALELIIGSIKKGAKQDLLRLGLIAVVFLLVMIAMAFLFVMVSQQTLYDGKVLIVAIFLLLLGASFLLSSVLSE